MSNMLEVIGNGFFKFPLVNEKENNFKEFISEMLDIYIKLIESMVDKDKMRILEKVISLSDMIKESLKEYYNGFPHESFSILSKGMDSLKPELEEVSKYFAISNNYFYRARKSSKELAREDMFHIPFEKRKKISNQRYSIAGFPCLYLGLTPYTCWEELDRPLPNNFTVSRVKLDESMNILNFAILPYEVRDYVDMYTRGLANIEKKVDEYRELLKSYLICLPIVMASSVRVKDHEAVFREEYIIPQMVTQWARIQGDVDGIQYYSTKTATYSKRNECLYRNIVIPTKETDSDKGYCKKLSDLITITDSIHCGSIDLFSEKYNTDFSKVTDQSNGLINAFIIKEIKHKDGSKHIYVENNQAQVHYSSSGFIEIVNLLHDKELGKVYVEHVKKSL